MHSQHRKYNEFFKTMLMKVAKEDISKVLARADITQSTRTKRLSAKKR